MTAEERNAIRFETFNTVMVATQFFPYQFQTYGDVTDCFEDMMKKSSIGDCTADDVEWCLTKIEEQQKQAKKNIEAENRRKQRYEEQKLRAKQRREAKKNNLQEPQKK